MYICQLPKQEQFAYYKRIKAYLINNECYSYNEMIIAMNSKLNDLNDLIF